jgi:hypothetical protein
MAQLQQGFVTNGMGFWVKLHGNNFEAPMSALECADQASPRACTVKAPHIASLATKTFFGKCQIEVGKAASDRAPRLG